MSGGLTRLTAVLMISLAFAGCFGGDDDVPHDECADDHAMEHGDGMEHSDEAMDESMEHQNESESLNLRLRQANETGAGDNETTDESDLPEDNEHGAIAESGAADCPGEADHMQSGMDECPEHGDEAMDESTEGDGNESAANLALTQSRQQENETDDDSTGMEDDPGCPEIDAAPEAERVVILDASAMGGDAPLEVTFEGFVEAYSSDDADGDGEATQYPVEPGAYTWKFIPGDGGANTEGDHTAESIEIVHTYTVEGTFEAYFQVTFADGEMMEAIKSITTTLADPRGPPQLVFEFGEAAGCVSDAGNNCIGNTIAQNGGPVESGIDGHFLVLDDRYWGLTFTTESDNADTDCEWYDADWEVSGEGNNGGGECTGTVTSGTVYIYVNPWATPATYMTITFSE